MQVAFWSTMHGQTGTTSNAIAIACAIALNYQIKTIITHNHFDKSGLEAAFLDKEYIYNSFNQFNDIGIDALGRTMKFNSIDDDYISRYTTSLLKGRLDLLIGTQGSNESLYLSDFNGNFEMVLSAINKHYELVLIDVTAGNNPFAKQVLEQSDIIVVNLNQNVALLETFFAKEYKSLKEKCLIMFGLYNADSKYNIKNIYRRYQFKNPVGTIPYNRGFADAFNEGKMIDFFMKNAEVKKGDINHHFIRDVRKAADNLLECLGIDIKNKKIGD